ncbi:MAG: hypothetical protein PGN34_07650 [Methylobacterium frigidaeris]
MRLLSHLDQVAFADLCAKAFEAQFSQRFPANGSFVRQKRGGREYFYYKGYDKAAGDAPGKSRFVYVGPVDDVELQGLVETFGRDKGLYRNRRELAGKLRHSGLPAPSPLEGRSRAILEEGIRTLARIEGKAPASYIPWLAHPGP